MKSTHTTPRSIRIPRDEWDAAKDEARRQGETVTDAVRRFLREYGTTPKDQRTKRERHMP